MSLLESAKRAVRVEGTDRHDEDLGAMIEAAKYDLGIAGVIVDPGLDPLIERAILTYCRLHFGREDPDVYDRLKRSYDEQKAQMQTATGYTDWGDETA